MTRYATNPYEENFHKWETERTRKRNEYWVMLRKARLDFQADECSNSSEHSIGAFRYWMERRWGLAIELVDGNISAGYNIIDESKYLLFQMKYA